jgi:DNA polymerase I-like protein with 3'-5' exonuclease and polymerase domains
MTVIDIETHDPNLKKKGSGEIRKDGHILGVGVLKNGVTSYYDIQSLKLKEVLAEPDTKVFHNASYDLSWLVNGYGLKVNGRYEDTLIREALIGNQKSYSLNNCCIRRGLAGKDLSDELDMTKLKDYPREMVAKYNAADLKATKALYEDQQKDIDSDGLRRVADIESRLIPCLLEMKGLGIRIDEKRRKEVADQLRTEYKQEMLAIENRYGTTNLNASLVHVFEKDGGQQWH